MTTTKFLKRGVPEPPVNGSPFDRWVADLLYLNLEEHEKILKKLDDIHRVWTWARTTGTILMGLSGLLATAAFVLMALLEFGHGK